MGLWKHLHGLGGKDGLLTAFVMSYLKLNVLNTHHCFQKQVNWTEKRGALGMETLGIYLSEDYMFS